MAKRPFRPTRCFPANSHALFREVRLLCHVTLEPQEAQAASGPTPDTQGLQVHCHLCWGEVSGWSPLSWALPRKASPSVPLLSGHLFLSLHVVWPAVGEPVSQPTPASDCDRPSASSSSPGQRKPLRHPLGEKERGTCSSKPILMPNLEL